MDPRSARSSRLGPGRKLPGKPSSRHTPAPKPSSSKHDALHSSREAIESGENWLRELRPPKPKKAQNCTEPLAEPLQRQRVSRRQQDALENAKQAGILRKRLAAQKASVLAGSDPTPAPRKPRSRSSQKMSAEEKSLRMALSLQQQEWAAEAESEATRRAELMGSVDGRLNHDAVQEAYLRELQRFDEDIASKELIKQLEREDRQEARREEKRERARARQAQQHAQQHGQQDDMEAVMLASLQMHQGHEQIDMSYENLINLAPVEVGLSAAARRALPRCSAAEAGDAGGDCCICLTEWDDGEETVVQLECGHCFHGECVEQWLESHVSCPTCKSVVDGERARHA
eukprot:TRINITY_DN14038_c0_g1_i1.p1 TRINITY_DN14038_c0_g1~~TRINITY_DN14038_c0_g1_i1.p1  ORF type:complete len:344 (-),score=85.47 TRINITY_DN14038_c0_g1_i1:263-1294(-)